MLKIKKKLQINCIPRMCLLTHTEAVSKGDIILLTSELSSSQKVLRKYFAEHALL